MEKVYQCERGKFSKIIGFSAGCTSDQNCVKVTNSTAYCYRGMMCLVDGVNAEDSTCGKPLLLIEST